MPATRNRRERPELPGTATEAAADDIAAMIRVDHAGEFGALRIYAGQLAVLERSAAASAETAAVRRMAEQERRHFETFDALVKARNIRPTALEPVWHLAGYALGAVTALMGEKAAMACTVAVEDVIDAHYAGQIARLSAQGTEDSLKETVERFRDDEIAHREEAVAHGAKDAPAYPLLSAAIRAGCRAAIRLSERL
jgi:ubiquinone biosynthesis monooxygenase Coq7